MIKRSSGKKNHNGGKAKLLKSTSANNSSVYSLYTEALRCQQIGNIKQAEKLYLKALEQDGGYFDAFNNLVMVYANQGHFAKVVGLSEKLLAYDPKQFMAAFFCANALKELGQFDKALLSYDYAINICADFSPAYFNRGNVLIELERINEALKDFKAAIALKPDYFQAYYNMGNTLYARKQLNEALECFGKAIRYKSDFINAHLNMGKTLCDLERFDEALISCNLAISYDPTLAETHNNKAEVLRKLGRFDEAIVCYDVAIRNQPDFINAYINKGITLREHLRHFEDALICFDQAIRLDSENASVYVHRAYVCYEICQYENALQDYEKALSIDPGLNYIQGFVLHCELLCCNWENIERKVDDLLQAVNDGLKISSPFYLLSIPASAKQIQHCAQVYMTDRFPDTSATSKINWKNNNQKIRIGYFSADYHNHATAHLISELIERHDRSLFEIISFSFGPVTNDDWQQRLKKSFDEFYDVSLMSDSDIAKLSRDKAIDIAVDLKGITTHSRMGIFQSRAAPLQVNYLGYPGTIGANYFDYIIADTVLIPAESRRYYSEKIVYLPDSYQPNDSTKTIDSCVKSRADHGLPDDGFVYCCFNNCYKITPDIFKIWMSILRAVKSSVLWLMDGGEVASHNLRRQAEKYNVDPDRLVFAPHIALSKHLSRLRYADLFLDTLYYNAHTTASDALWSGVPVLTCPGETFSARVAASLLNSVGLQEMVVNTYDSYETLAIRLADRPDQLKKIQKKLTKDRVGKPLFDMAIYTKNMEAAYTKMHNEHKQGHQPEHIFVNELL